MKKVELLAPAKNLKSIKAASKYADSVYFGIEKFNMRMRSENIALENLTKVMDFCRKAGLKAYLATNILLYDNDLSYLHEVIEKGKEAGIHAVIVHDVAAIEVAKEIGVPFHISTQCNLFIFLRNVMCPILYLLDFMKN
jgi:putative protease